MGILNSLRNMNFFEFYNFIDSSSNVGGFGIDGAVSTLVGQSMVNKNKLSEIPTISLRHDRKMFRSCYGV